MRWCVTVSDVNYGRIPCNYGRIPCDFRIKVEEFPVLKVEEFPVLLTGLYT